ncbi:MAG: hypothetical protein AAB527_01305 [Patescibacteria group bacterium]
MRRFLDSEFFYLGVVILTIGAGALYLFWPIISGGFLFSFTRVNEFTNLYYYKSFSSMGFFINTLKMLPNWSPAYNSGYPINLTLDGVMNPIFIITLKFLPPILANNIMIFLFFAINSLVFYALARALMISRTGSLIAAISYMFSGVMLGHMAITVIVAIMPFLPLSFLCCLKILQGKTNWLWLWLPLLIYSWIGGYAEFIIYSLVAMFFFAIYLTVKNRKSENFSYRYPLLFFGCVILSVIILSPWFLSVLYFIQFSNRSGGFSVESAGHAATSLSDFINMFYPGLSFFYGNFLPLPLESWRYLLYIGTLPLILVFTSFFIKAKKEKGHLVFFLALAMGSILMTVNNSPLFWLFHQIPVLNWLRGYWKWDFIAVFSMAILAGYGFDNIADFFANRFSKKIVIFLWGIMIFILLASGAIAIFDQKIKTTISDYGIARYKNTPDRAFNRPENYYQNNIRKMADTLVDNFSLKNKRVLLMIVLWTMALAYLTTRKYGLRSSEKWKIMAVLITLLGSTLPWTGLPKGPPVSYLATESETAKYIHSINPYQSNKLPITTETSSLFTPYRIFLYLPDQFVAELSEKYGVDMTESEKQSPFQREMMGNHNALMFNFDIFHAIQPLQLRRMENYAYNLARRQEAFTKESYQDKTPFEEYIKAFSDDKNMRFLGGQNIQYILTPFKLTNGLEPIFTARVIDGKVPVYVYENPYFMPRWYFADKIIWTEPDDEKAFSDLQTIDDFKKTTLLEKQTLNDPAITSKTDFQDELELQLYTAGKLIIKTKTKNYRFLVFSESRFPDFWQATISGINSPIYTANYLYQAVLVPPGENTVEFNYPKLWEQGLISLNSLIQ